MVDEFRLADLLPLLKTHGVIRYKKAGLEIEFGNGLPSISQPELAPPLASHTEHVEDHLPPDLRTDAITDDDKVLNWSAAPVGDESIPLVGDISQMHVPNEMLDPRQQHPPYPDYKDLPIP